MATRTRLHYRLTAEITVDLVRYTVGVAVTHNLQLVRRVDAVDVLKVGGVDARIERRLVRLALRCVRRRLDRLAGCKLPSFSRTVKCRFRGTARTSGARKAE